MAASSKSTTVQIIATLTSTSTTPVCTLLADRTLITCVPSVYIHFTLCADSQSSSSSSIAPSSIPPLSPTNSTTNIATPTTSITTGPAPSSSSPANPAAIRLSQGAIIGIAFGGFGSITTVFLIAMFLILSHRRQGRRKKLDTTRPRRETTLHHPSKRPPRLQPLSPTYTHFSGSPAPSMRMRATTLSSPSVPITPLASSELPTLPPRSPLRDSQSAFPTPTTATTTATAPPIPPLPKPFRHSSVQSRIREQQHRSIHEIDGRSLRNQEAIWRDDLIDESDSLWRGYGDHYVHHDRDDDDDNDDDDDADGGRRFLRRNSTSSSAVLEGRTMI